jgi:hypothetical protein
MRFTPSRRQALSLLLPATLLLTGAARAAGAGRTFHVSPDGDDNGPGSLQRPWRSVEVATERLRAGDTLLLRRGTYRLARQVRFPHAGTPGRPIRLASYPGETAELDASDVVTSDLSPPGPEQRYNGAIQIERTAHIRIERLRLVKSHDAGITIRDSSHVVIRNNTIESTFSSGIAAWDTEHKGLTTRHIVVTGNTVIRPNIWEMAPAGREKDDIGTPQEGISIAGAIGFEVSHNVVSDGGKEGIDVKETSRDGVVFRNHVHHMARQGIYLDSWFGAVENVVVSENLVHDCRGAAVALSVENGSRMDDIVIRDNILVNNKGTAILFSRWGVDGPRSRIRIERNTIDGNGYGETDMGRAYYWITGGIYFYSGSVSDVVVRRNVVSRNNGFQIGYSARFADGPGKLAEALREKRVDIRDNLLNQTERVSYPISNGWPAEQTYAMEGRDALVAVPRFADPDRFDYRLRSPRGKYGASAKALEWAAGIGRADAAKGRAP